MAEFAMLKGRGNLDMHLLPSPYDTWKVIGDGTYKSDWNNSMMTSLNAYVIKGLLEYVKGDASDIAVIELMALGSTVSYASEWKQPDRSAIICSLSGNGNFTASVVSSTGAYTELPSFGAPGDQFDLSSIYLTALLVCAAKYEDGGVFQKCKELLTFVKDHYDSSGELPEPETRTLCDILKCGLGERGKIPLTLDAGGNVTKLVKLRVDSNEFSGTVICGVPDVIWSGNPLRGTTGSVNIGSLRKKDYVKAYVDSLSWTPEEEKLIPDYPDDFEVPQEVVGIIERFIKSSSMRHPIRNVAWKSGTAYGKSTGVEILACVLRTPLLKLTCFSTMETQDFLSAFVPNTDMEATGNLPTWLEIDADPEGAYLAVTGREKPGATAEDAFEACLKAYATRQTGSRFKLVQSNYIRALRRGYVVEIQEFSRIREKGTLVGLNETFAVGGRLPMVDGTYSQRHKNALAIWTDNVNYISTGPVDASVMRRMDYVIHSRELSKEQALARVRKNTGFANESYLEVMYSVWDAIREYCRANDIDEGDISVNELEMWVCMISIVGVSHLRETCLECIVTKATSDQKEQDNIMDTVVEVKLGGL